MDIELLHDFLVIADCKSLAQAADRRHISNSALSRRLSTLEEWVGVTLVDRTRRPHALTASGRLFHDVAANVVSSLQEIRESLNRELPGQGIITFALPHTLRDGFFPDFLEIAASTGVAFETQLVVSTEAARLYEIFAKGACDFFLYYSADDYPFELPGRSVSIELANESLVPVSIPDEKRKPLFPLPGRSDRYTPQLSQGPGSYFMELVALRMRKLSRAAFLNPMPMTEGNTPFIQLVLEGRGLAWLPMSLVRPHIAAGEIVMAAEPEWTIPMKIRIARSLSPLSTRAEALWGGLKSISENKDHPVISNS